MLHFDTEFGMGVGMSIHQQLDKIRKDRPAMVGGDNS